MFAQAGFAFSTMGVLPNWLVGFAATMAAGGPMSLFWGFVSNDFVFMVQNYNLYAQKKILM